MVITGFRISVKTLPEIERELKKIQEGVNKRAEKVYHKLLGDEIANVCDGISLNIYQRNQNESIYDSCVSILDAKINRAQMLGSESEYNLNVFVNILFYDEYTYLKVTSNNGELLKAFHKLEEYNLSETECQDSSNQKTIIWQKLHAMYRDREPVSVNLTPKIKPKAELIKYPTMQERCHDQAVRSVFNHCLAQLSMGEQIGPEELARMVLKAMEMVSQKKEDIRRKEAELSQILIDFNTNDQIIFNTTEEGEDNA